jgi:hypothetical protein
MSIMLGAEAGQGCLLEISRVAPFTAEMMGSCILAIYQ